MKWSISSRVFISFLLVMVAFAAVGAYVVYRMSLVRRQLLLVGQHYVPLTIAAGELHAVQQSLLETLEQHKHTSAMPSFVARQIELARRFRRQRAERALKRLGKELRSEDDSIQAVHQRFIIISRLFERNHTLFERLKAGSGRNSAYLALYEDLLSRERQVAAVMRRLRVLLRNRLGLTAATVASNQRTSSLAAISLMVVALVMSMLVTVRVRLLLRPLKRLAAAVQSFGAGDYSHRVQHDSDDELGLLAQAFNHMAMQIGEREQRLLRSERMAAAGALAAHITHEVRNPLNAISLNTEMLEEEIESGNCNPEARQMCRTIRSEIDRLTHTTENYLRFARRPPVQLAAQDVRRVLQSVVDLLSAEFAVAQIEIETFLPKNSPNVLLDEGQFRQAVINLMQNAKQAFDGQPGRVSVGVTPLGSQLSVTIDDDGPGIPEDLRGRLFEPFTSAREGGSGLGLALVQQIVHDHQGTITAHSETGKHTTFTITLPVAQLAHPMNLSLDD